MPRLRFTLDGAKAEAARLATELVAAIPGGNFWRCTGVGPDWKSPAGRSSKHPVRWVVTFVAYPLEAPMDGGEMFVSVDLGSGSVAVRD